MALMVHGPLLQDLQQSGNRYQLQPITRAAPPGRPFVCFHVMVSVQVLNFQFYPVKEALKGQIQACLVQ